MKQVKKLQNCFINGRWHIGKGNEMVVKNPATNDITWECNTADVNDVNLAYDAANSAFNNWALTPIASRIDIIEKYRALLEENEDKLINDIVSDTGKPLWEAKTEVATMINKVDISIKAYNQRTPNKSSGDIEKVLLTHRPHGICAVFGPYNFPGHLPNGHIIPALIAGNCIIFKPSELAPSIGARMVKLLADAGVPDGVINFLPGNVETAKAIVSNKLLRGFFFTGSSLIGESIHKQLAGRTNVILALEMGGNNPLIIQEDILQTKDKILAAVYNTIQSAFITAGQRCTCARRLIVPYGDAGDNFINKLIIESKKIKIDSPMANPQPFYSTVISKKAVDMLLSAQDMLIKIGGKQLLKMKLLSTKMAMVSPAIIDLTSVDNVPDEEYFGPLLKIYRVGDLNEAIKIANDTKYGLSAGIFTENKSDWIKFYSLSNAGIVNWNKPLTGASGSLPFGGTGRSGNHRPGAYYAADYCAYPVASVTSEKIIMPKIQSNGISIK